MVIQLCVAMNKKLDNRYVCCLISVMPFDVSNGKCMVKIVCYCNRIVPGGAQFSRDAHPSRGLNHKDII